MNTSCQNTTKSICFCWYTNISNYNYMFRPFLVAIIRLYIPSFKSYVQYAMFDDEISIILVYNTIYNNVCIPAEANKLSCVLTTSYIVFMFTHTTGMSHLKLKFVEYLWNVTDVRKRNPQRKILSHCHSVDHKSDMN